MTKLKAPVVLETAFGEYTLTEQLGEGGAGRVYGGNDAAGVPVAVKVLTNTSTDKRRRFKNEIAFLARNTHPHIVTVTDHGVANAGSITGPFYVMARFEGNLRNVMSAGIPPGDVLKLFGQVLDGAEAAHLQGAVHRDLKPENVLFDPARGLLAVADFGVANFTESLLVTAVQTAPTQRLANFLYAAPEQRVAGRAVGVTADIYALGLILNEMFTRDIAHGTDYRHIAGVAADFGFLDGIVALMLKQNPTERPGSIAAVKQLIMKYQAEAVSLQRLRQIDNAVIRVGEIDDPLAHEPPNLVGAEWDNGQLTLTLDRPVNNEWVKALYNMGNYTSAMGSEPQRFRFMGTKAVVPVQRGAEQMVIDYFKAWLPLATRVLHQNLQYAAREEEARQRDLLRRDREIEEQRMRVNNALRV